MSKNETQDRDEGRPSWVTSIGEADGAYDKRVELLEYRADTLVKMLETIDQDLSSAFPTIADIDLRPKVVRAIEIVDLLVSDDALDVEVRNALAEELDMLDFEMMRGMRAKFVQENDVRIGAIRGDDRAASEDHVIIVPEGWDNTPKH